jgi:N6-L-threonylcarbamoyladenine synthase
MDKKYIRHILAIETSCDETAASVIRFQETENSYRFNILSNAVASQIEIHKKWGGVWPELASRAHLEAMIPVLEEALLPLTQNQKLKIKNQKYNSKIKNKSLIHHSSFIIQNYIDTIAVTTGPGLIGSLLMGVETAQILGALYDKPVVPVNHLEGHIYAAFAAQAQNPKSKVQNDNPKLKIKNSFIIHNSSFTIPRTRIFPILALVVSGGHTSLILMDKHLNYRTVGQTVDDAAGEAFDKVARILGLSYPGGPEIEKLAKSGDENAYELPVSMRNSRDFNFSFSGLKTAVLYLTKNPMTGDKRPYNKQNLAASFQKTVARILTEKTVQAIKKYKPKTFIFCGGVSANSYLRQHLVSSILQLTTNDQRPTILVPPKELSTDNAVGIGIAGGVKLSKNKVIPWHELEARDNFPIDKS